MQIWCQFRIQIIKIAAEIAPSNGAIWDEFSEQRWHQSIQKSNSFRVRLALFLMQLGANLMHILVG